MRNASARTFMNVLVVRDGLDHSKHIFFCFSYRLFWYSYGATVRWCRQHTQIASDDTADMVLETLAAGSNRRQQRQDTNRDGTDHQHRLTAHHVIRDDETNHPPLQ